MGAYREFPATAEGREARRGFWLSEEGVALIGQWLREGESVERVAVAYVGVADATLYKWARRPEGGALAREIRRSAEACDAMVERSLFRRAVGYEVEEEDWELVEGEMRRVRVRRRHVPGDVKAQLSWLYSRRPERWRASQEPLDRSREARERVQEVVVRVVAAAQGAAEGGGGLDAGVDTALSTDPAEGAGEG